MFDDDSIFPRASENLVEVLGCGVDDAEVGLDSFSFPLDVACGGPCRRSAREQFFVDDFVDGLWVVHLFCQAGYKYGLALQF